MMMMRLGFHLILLIATARVIAAQIFELDDETVHDDAALMLPMDENEAGELMLRHHGIGTMNLAQEHNDDGGLEFPEPELEEVLGAADRGIYDGHVEVVEIPSTISTVYLATGPTASPLPEEVETQAAIFKSVGGNCPGSFLLPAPHWCSEPECDPASCSVQTCAQICIKLGETCHGFTFSRADGKCYPKSIDTCDEIQRNAVNTFYGRRGKTLPTIYNFTIEAVNPNQSAMAHCLVNGFPPPTDHSKYSFEYSNGTKIIGGVMIEVMTAVTVQASIAIPQVPANNEYILCSVQGDSGQRVAEWATTRVYRLPVITEAPEIVDTTPPSPIYRLVKWRRWQPDVDFGDGPVEAYYLYMKKGNDDWGIYGKAEMMSEVVCGSGNVCQKRIGVLQLNTPYSIAIAAIRPGIGGVGKMSPMATFKTPCEKLEALNDPPQVQVNREAPGKATLTWRRFGENCVHQPANRVVRYEVVVVGHNGWNLHKNISIAERCSNASVNCTVVQLEGLQANVQFAARVIRVSATGQVVESETLNFKSSCGKPFVRVQGIAITKVTRDNPKSQMATMTLAWQPVKPADTGCSKVDFYTIRIYDRHPSIPGTLPLRTINVPGDQWNVTIAGVFGNNLFYVAMTFKNNEQMESSPSDLVPFRLDDIEAGLVKGAVIADAPIDYTLLVSLVTAAFIITIILVLMSLYIVYNKGKQAAFGMDTPSPNSNRKSSVSSGDMPMNGHYHHSGAVYVNVEKKQFHQPSNEHVCPEPSSIDCLGDGVVAIPNGMAAINGQRQRPRPPLNGTTSRRSAMGAPGSNGGLLPTISSTLGQPELKNNAMYSSQYRSSNSNGIGNGNHLHSNGSYSHHNGNGHAINAASMMNNEDDNVYSTRLDVSGVAQQKF